MLLDQKCLFDRANNIFFVFTNPLNEEDQTSWMVWSLWKVDTFKNFWMYSSLFLFVFRWLLSCILHPSLKLLLLFSCVVVGNPIKMFVDFDGFLRVPPLFVISPSSALFLDDENRTTSHRKQKKTGMTKNSHGGQWSALWWLTNNSSRTVPSTRWWVSESSTSRQSSFSTSVINSFFFL